MLRDVWSFNPLSQTQVIQQKDLEGLLQNLRMMDGWCVQFLRNVQDFMSIGRGYQRWPRFLWLHIFLIFVRLFNHGSTVPFFPTCQVRVVRFYLSCLLLLLPASSPPLLLLSSSSSRCPPPLVVLLVSLSSSSSCSTATRDPQCSLPDLNHDHPRPVFPAGPQPRVSPPSVPCRTSTTTIHAQCSLPDLNREYPRQKICHIECQKICQIEC